MAQKFASTSPSWAVVRETTQQRHLEAVPEVSHCAFRAEFDSHLEDRKTAWDLPPKS